MKQPFELTESERQLIEIIRQQENDKTDFRLVIECVDRAWEIAMSISPHDESHGARGVGKTFNQAWDDMGPLGA